AHDGCPCVRWKGKDADAEVPSRCVQPLGVRTGSHTLNRHRGGGSAIRAHTPLPFGGAACAGRRIRDVGGGQYARAVASMSSSAPPPRRRRAAFRGSSVGLVVMGIVFDVGALMNVPGTAELPTGEDARIGVTDAGTALALLVVAAWIAVIWRRRLPLLALVAGGVLALVGISYVLLLVGAVAAVR